MPYEIWMEVWRVCIPVKVQLFYSCLFLLHGPYNSTTYHGWQMKTHKDIIRHLQSRILSVFHEHDDGWGEMKYKTVFRFTRITFSSSHSKIMAWWWYHFTSSTLWWRRSKVTGSPLLQFIIREPIISGQNSMAIHQSLISVTVAVHRPNSLGSRDSGNLQSRSH